MRMAYLRYAERGGAETTGERRSDADTDDRDDADCSGLEMLALSIRSNPQSEKRHWRTIHYIPYLPLMHALNARTAAPKVGVFQNCVGGGGRLRDPDGGKPRNDDRREILRV